MPCNTASVPATESSLVPSFFGSILPTCANWVACTTCTNGYSCISTSTIENSAGTSLNLNDQSTGLTYLNTEALRYGFATIPSNFPSTLGSNINRATDLSTAGSSQVGLMAYLPNTSQETGSISQSPTNSLESNSAVPTISHPSICLTINLPTPDILGRTKTAICLHGDAYTPQATSTSSVLAISSPVSGTSISSVNSTPTSGVISSQSILYGAYPTFPASTTPIAPSSTDVTPICDNFQPCPTCISGYLCPSPTDPNYVNPSTAASTTPQGSSLCDGWKPCGSCSSGYACPVALSVPSLDYSQNFGLTTVYTCPGGHATSTVSVKTLDGEIITCSNWQPCPTCALSSTCLSASSDSSVYTPPDGYYIPPTLTSTIQSSLQGPIIPTCTNYIICPTCALGYVCLGTPPDQYQPVSTTQTEGFYDPITSVQSTSYPIPSLVYYSISVQSPTVTLPLPPLCASYVACEDCVYGVTCAPSASTSTLITWTSSISTDQIKTITDTLIYVYNTCGQPDLLTSFTIPTKTVVTTKNTCAPSTSTFTKKDICTTSVSYPNE